MMHRWRIVAVLTSLQAACLAGAPGAPAQSLVEKVRQGAQEGKIAYKLTTPQELQELLGPPDQQERQREGDADLLILQYGAAQAVFAKPGQEAGLPMNVPHILYQLTIKDEPIDIGEQRLIVLRSLDDLEKFDTFCGYAGASLASLDLRDQKAALEKRPFDSRTRWPGLDRLPAGFDPLRRLEKGKSPGLGVPGLHAQGLDGRGVGLAIIDQPLLRDHQEYAGRLVRYEPIDVQGVPVQMHGAPVSSIAVGRTCGVAPGASLYYYAVPMWKWNDDQPYAELLEKIIALNDTLTEQPRIRVVSISLGAFSQRSNFDLWQAAVEKAAQNGILVVTCDPKFLWLATLRRNPDGDPNDPAGYTTGLFAALRAALSVPAGNRTTASHVGPDVYTYWVEGGMSWAVPYLAGLATLAFQVEPEIPPARIVELWTTTATKTGAGPIVNPPKFIEAVRARTNQTMLKAQNHDPPGRPGP
jgi:serine protease AprX